MSSATDIFTGPAVKRGNLPEKQWSSDSAPVYVAGLSTVVDGRVSVPTVKTADVSFIAPAARETYDAEGVSAEQNTGGLSASML